MPKKANYETQSPRITSAKTMLTMSQKKWAATGGKLCQLCYDLLTIPKQGKQRSRVVRRIIIMAQSFLASRNQIQLIILELSDLVTE